MFETLIYNVKSWLAEQLFFRKLNNPLGYFMVILLTMGLAYVFSMIGFQFSIVLAAGIIGGFVMLGSFLNLQIGLATSLAACAFVMLGAKYVNAPLGVVHDGLLIIMVIHMLVGAVTQGKSILTKSPITYFVLLWVGYCFIQVLNPWAHSKIAWALAVRAIAVMMLFYFVACYAFDSYKKTMWGIKAVILTAVVFALYGLKQEFFGFSQRELIWLYSNDDVFQRIFQWSRLRVFSFCVDPTTFGIFMSYIAVICFILVLGPFSTKRKIALVIAGSLMMAAMAYAGSRTPFVMIPLGLIFFTVLTLDKKVIAIMSVGFVLGTAFMLKSTGNAVIYRIQSSFNLEASGDTMNVRLQNQAFIQPFIHRHPFGAGIGSTGEWGARFSPDTMLAGFAHDSAFVRVAVELGWIGLIIYMILHFLVLKAGIYYYYRVQNPKIKIMYAAITTALFMISLGSYPQEVVALLPTSVVWCLLVAAVVRLKDFDDPIPIEEKAIIIKDEKPNRVIPSPKEEEKTKKELEEITTYNQPKTYKDPWKLK